MACSRMRLRGLGSQSLVVESVADWATVVADPCAGKVSPVSGVFAVLVGHAASCTVGV